MTDTAWHPANRDRALFEAGKCVPLYHRRWPRRQQVDASRALAAGLFTMYDDVNASLIPSSAIAAAYYGNGPFANYGAVRARLPHAILAPTMLRAFTGDLKTINDWEHGVSWDCEPSLFTAQQAGELVRLTRAQGVMPRLYFPLSWATAVVSSIAAAGFKRSDVMLHSAHWTMVPHICSGIATREWGVISMDSTQYTDRALGLSLDASLQAPHSLGPFGPKPQPKPKPHHHVSYHGGGKAYFQVEHNGATSDGEFALDSGGWSMRQPGWKIHGIPAPKPAPHPQPHPTRRNPMPGAKPTRIDQGADYNLTSAGYIAPFKCKIIRAVTFTSGWQGGWIVYEILEGPFTGQGVYVAEGVVPAAGIVVGRTVNAGTKLCDVGPNRFFNPPLIGNIETGWVAPNADEALARTLPGYGGDQSVQAIACGAAMDRFNRWLGVPAAANESGHTPDFSLLPAGLQKALERIPA